MGKDRAKGSLTTWELIPKVVEAINNNAFEDIDTLLREELGISGLILGSQVRDPCQPESQQHMIAFNVRNDWQELYYKENLAEVDTVLADALSSPDLTNWGESYLKAGSNHKFYRLAHDHNLMHGASHSMFHKDSLVECSVTSITFDSSPDQMQLEAARAVLPVINLALGNRQLWPQPHLTKKQVEVLKWLRDGKGSWEISKIMNIKEGSVKFHVRNIMTTLNANNRSQALAIAISLGIIDY